MRTARARDRHACIEESRGMGLRLIGFVDPEAGDAPPAKLGRYEVFPLDALSTHSAEAGHRRDHLRRQHAGTGPAGAGDAALRQSSESRRACSWSSCRPPTPAFTWRNSATCSCSACPARPTASCGCSSSACSMWASRSFSLAVVVAAAGLHCRHDPDHLAGPGAVPADALRAGRAPLHALQVPLA